MILNFITLVAPILLMVSYVPQIIKLAKDKTAEGISLSFWIILDLTLLCFVLLALSSEDLRMLAMQSLNLILALIVTVQVIMYQ